MKPSRDFGFNPQELSRDDHLTHGARLDVVASSSWIDPEGVACLRAKVLRRVEDEMREEDEEDDGFDLLDCNWSTVTRRRK